MNILRLFVLCMLFFACKKDKPYGPTRIAGFVNVYGSDEGISNATVWLIEESYTGFFSSSYATIAKTTSDINGIFSFDFNASEGHSYYLEAWSPNHFPMPSVTAWVPVIKPGSHNTMTVSLDGFAIAKFRLIKNSDAEHFSFGATMYDLNAQYWEPVIYSKDTTLYSLVRGNRNLTIYAWAKHKDTSIAHHVKKYFKTHDTTLIEINY